MKKGIILIIVLTSLAMCALVANVMQSDRSDSANPVAAPAPLPPPKADPVAEKKAKREREIRMDACAQIENALVQDGNDVEVTLMNDNDRNMVIVGPTVNRLFVRQVAASGIGRRLKERGIDKVTFMKDRFTWVGEWDVFYGKIEADN